MAASETTEHKNATGTNCVLKTFDSVWARGHVRKQYWKLVSQGLQRPFVMRLIKEVKRKYFWYFCNKIPHQYQAEPQFLFDYSMHAQHFQRKYLKGQTKNRNNTSIEINGQREIYKYQFRIFSGQTENTGGAQHWCSVSICCCAVWAWYRVASCARLQIQQVQHAMQQKRSASHLMHVFLGTLWLEVQCWLCCDNDRGWWMHACVLSLHACMHSSS